MTPPLICLDAGHGGHDPGAIGPTGLRECDVVLDIAGRLAGLLVMRGWAIMTTRSSNLFVSLGQRAYLANQRGPVAFLSVHANAHINRGAFGYEVWTSPGQTKADPLASRLFGAWGHHFPHATGRKDLLDGDVDKEGNLFVLTHTNAPAALFEIGFISHPESEALMRSDDFRHLAAVALADGLEAWRKLDMEER